MAGDWLTEYKYPFRASNPVEFHEQYRKLCEVSLDERRNLLYPLREYLTEKFDNKEEWVEKMVKLYSGNLYPTIIILLLNINTDWLLIELFHHTFEEGRRRYCGKIETEVWWK